jgi:hypothetical protein
MARDVFGRVRVCGRGEVERQTYREIQGTFRRAKSHYPNFNQA